MTISSTTAKVTYNGNGSTTVFAYTFRILDDDDILVQLKDTTTGVITTQTKTTDYSVSSVGSASGGNITFVTAPASGNQVILTRSVPLLQETDYTEYDTFPAESHESALDKLTMIAQQLNEVVNRSVKVDAGVSGFDGTLPTPTANSLIRFNSGATGWDLASLSDLGAYSFPVGTGILAQTAASVSVARTLTGTANEITVTNGSGVSGNPTFSLPSALTFTGKTVTGGTFSSPTFTSPTVTGGTYSAPTITSPTISGTVTTTATYSAPVLLSGTTHADVTDPTKKIQHVLSGITTGTTRTITWPNCDLPRHFIQEAHTIVSAVATGTTQMPYDNTIPQNTEGDQYMSLSITPKSSSNLLCIEVIALHYTDTASRVLSGALFQDTNANALNAIALNFPGGNTASAIVMRHWMTAGTTSATTFKYRAGQNAAATTSFSGSAGSGVFGGVMGSSMTIREYSA